MIISKHLIAKLLPKLSSVDDASFINACNAIGIEVEKVIRHPQINNCVIGEIISIENHPNADRLHVVQVKVSNEQINTIVCGANNLKLNKKVIVALNNAKLHDGRAIEYKELRGILSQGMICAYGELTPHSQFLNNEDADGIILLDEAIIGDDNVAKYIGLDDTIYDISLPSNRNDLNGALFLCQELAGFFKLDYTIPSITDVIGQMDATFKITYDRKLCNGFSVFRINDIDTNQST
jgi:phenylalanyl-tRNA synthetase beta chain